MRLQIIKTTYFVIICLIFIRLFYWQVIRADDLTSKGENQRFSSKEILAPRGEILFSDESILVANQPIYSAFVQPKVIDFSKDLPIKDSYSYKKDVTQKMAQVLYESNKEEIEIPPEATMSADFDLNKYKDKKVEESIKKIADDLLSKFTKDLYWVSLGWKVDSETKRKLDALKVVGLGFDQTTGRFYPEGSSSAQLLGFVGSNVYGSETGYFGLEGFYDGELRGKKGIITEEKDALGLPILIGEFNSKDPKTGKTLVLNIDRTIQYIVESKLKAAVEKYKAKGGSAVVMDPKTGNILAMASFPSYDPIKPTKFSNEVFRNPITADGYEPGSTFKVLVMSAGINEGLVTPETICDICAGPVSLSGYTIRTWNNQYKANSSMTDVIIHSDNTGMVYVGNKLGIDKMYSYIKNFGFGELTGIDLQDETSPDIRPKDDWKEIDLATSSFGQGISVTALQVVRAVGAIANGGKLMEPHIVKEIRDNGKIYKVSPRVVSTPISAESAKAVTGMMVKAVDEGEAKFAKPKGFQIAGKTGTAQIPVAGHYDPTKTIASFVGFAPVEDPKFVMLVRFTEPQSSIFGAETAAPTFFTIAREIFSYYGIAPSE